MNNIEAIEMMQRCHNEIIELRRVINSLKPKADAYDNLAIILGLLPKKSQGLVEDLAWGLNKRIDELRQLEAAPKPENKA